MLPTLHRIAARPINVNDAVHVVLVLIERKKGCLANFPFLMNIHHRYASIYLLQDLK